MTTPGTQSTREYKFPVHDGPRVWFVTCANSPIGASLCRQLLAHGDSIVAGLLPAHMNEGHNGDFQDLIDDISSNDQGERQQAKIKLIELDIRVMSQCQAAVAEAVQVFGHVDILFCCSSECVVGTVEELSQNQRTLSLVQDQFETNFFGPVNMIKAMLPILRKKGNGHIILLTAVTGHLGTPGMSVYCASQWAIEGYCDSLAYEIAPFNIKMTIVQPNMEINVLTHKITSAPPMQAYEEENNPAPFSRNILSSLLDRIEGSSEPTTGDQLHSSNVTSLEPPLSKLMKETLVAETIYAIVAIGGLENPPARHIVGIEGVQAVKEKLKTVSEELEDFAECSCAADIEGGNTG